jgi:hypothetical protein
LSSFGNRFLLLSQFAAKWSRLKPLLQFREELCQGQR